MAKKIKKTSDTVEIRTRVKKDLHRQLTDYHKTRPRIYVFEDTLSDALEQGISVILQNK